MPAGIPAENKGHGARLFSAKQAKYVLDKP
jgi:hypothetical protein